MAGIYTNTYGYPTTNPYSAYSYESQSTTSQRTTSSTSTSSSTSGTANSAAGSSSVTLSDEAKALAANRATVEDITGYRDKLKAKEAAGYREELVRFGMRAEAQFEIQSDGKGGYTIKADYRDKPFLEAYFRENPEHIAAFMKQDKITAQDVLAYKQGMQDEFDTLLAAGLEKLGLPEDAEYEVFSDGKGGYAIKADDETKALIDGYLKENPALVKTLTKISTAMDVDLSKNTSTGNSTTNNGNIGSAGVTDTAEDKAARKQINQLATFLLMQANGASGLNQLQISSYKKDLQSQFEAQMKSDLRKLGVDEDIKFTLRADKQGNVTVVTSSEDKAIIEKYLKDNPDMANAFIKLEKVSGESSTPQSQRYDAAAMRQRIQLESMNAWFMGTGMSSNLGGSAAATNFSGGDMAMLNSMGMSGLNKLV